MIRQIASFFFKPQFCSLTSKFSLTAWHPSNLRGYGVTCNSSKIWSLPLLLVWTVAHDVTQVSLVCLTERTNCPVSWYTSYQVPSDGLWQGTEEEHAVHQKPFNSSSANDRVTNWAQIENFHPRLLHELNDLHLFCEICIGHAFKCYVILQ